MKIVYLGTPDFAVLPLKKIFDAGYEILGVVTQPDKAVGRKQILTSSPVKQTAIELGLKVLQYDKIRDEGVEDLKTLKPDLMVTCAYGQILSQEILDIPTLGTINIHASLLPKLRGSSPIQWSIINGDEITGITIMMTELGIDTGDIILKKELTIGADETAGELFDRLSVLGADAIIEALELFKNNKVVKTPQNHSEATFTKMLKKEFGKIDFNNDAKVIHNLVRGLNPWPVAFTSLNGEVIKIYKTKVIKGEDVPGKIVKCDEKNGLIIACKKDFIEVLELQRAGGKRMNAKDFLRGFKVCEGTIIND